MILVVPLTFSSRSNLKSKLKLKRVKISQQLKSGCHLLNSRICDRRRRERELLMLKISQFLIANKRPQIYSVRCKWSVTISLTARADDVSFILLF